MRRTVLVVDDQEINRQILNKILSSDYEVLMAADGAQALDIMRAKHEDISAILLDIIMPGMDGYGVLKQRKLDAALSTIPVIVTTQKDGDSSEIKALEYGANDFVSKPYHPNILLLRLQNLIQMREATATADMLQIDTLTGLLNKEAFYHKVENRLKDKNKRYEIIAGDLEKFRMVNDTYGEEEGDKLLQFVSHCLQEEFTDESYLLAHGYGDQFFIFAEQSDENHKLVEKVANEIVEYPLDTKVFIKFGIYEIDYSGIAVRTMCDRAIFSVNTIKEQYDEVFCHYNDSLREKLLLEQKITSVMKEALVQKQFMVYFQAKYDAVTEKIVGAEALIRWIHPKLGFMSPGEFIPLFEKNGFITEVDKYVWEEVCRFLHEFKQSTGKCLPISMNVSRRDIYNENLPELFMNLADKYELDRRCIHLEVTETAYTDNPKQLIDVISRLKELGFVIEMDDFGSGYSSLNMLSELPLDVLKLDMKFIQNEFLHKRTNNIISSVINLAKWMNLLVIAEGVETKEQLEYLKGLDCNLIQGYYFARPMPEKDFLERLSTTEILPIYDVNAYAEARHVEKKTIKDHFKKQMLVVDDMAMNRAILGEYFQDWFAVIEKADGADAWEYIRKNYRRISIIMLDLFMPGMDGFSLLEKLKEDSKLKDIPVVITSQDNESAKRAKELHAEAFLPKPYRQEEARELVESILEV